MSIVTCSECSKEISSNADTCPHCGNPIEKDGKLVMIQGTKKKWKVFKIIAWVLLIIGLPLAIEEKSGGEMLLSLSFVSWVTSKLGSWWTNG